MPFKVLLTSDAARDLDEVYDYITYARYEQGRTVPTVPKLSELLPAVASRKDFVLTESQA